MRPPGRIGGDGVLRAVRDGERWFMDYRNADGSLSEMCGNGIRVFARYLLDHEGATTPLEIDTRDGIKTITLRRRHHRRHGHPRGLRDHEGQVDGVFHEALHVSMGNPHAVAFVDSLDEAGSLLEEPGFDREVYPDGVNVEFVVRRSAHHVAMRVHERGSGETRSCGTGACAVMVAAALADEAPRGTAYRVDVPGGSLEITWTEDDRILMTGPAVLVAEGTTDL